MRAPEWSSLAPKTRAALDHLRPLGNFKADNWRRQHVIRLRNKMSSDRRTQDLFVAAVSRMSTIGMDLGYTDRNPASRIEHLNDPESFAPWRDRSSKRVQCHIGCASLTCSPCGQDSEKATCCASRALDMTAQDS